MPPHWARYTESARQSTASLMAFISQIGKYYNLAGSEYTAPWLCVMDLASVHIPRDTRQRMKRHLSWVSVTFVPEQLGTVNH
eukprot:3228103-Amphidinium_carterae.1